MQAWSPWDTLHLQRSHHRTGELLYSSFTGPCRLARRFASGVSPSCRSKEAALAAFQEGWAGLQVAGASWDAAGPRADVAREADAHISQLRTQKARCTDPLFAQPLHILAAFSVHTHGARPVQSHCWWACLGGIGHRPLTVHPVASTISHCPAVVALLWQEGSWKAANLPTICICCISTFNWRCVMLTGQPMLSDRWRRSRGARRGSCRRR